MLAARPDPSRDADWWAVLGRWSAISTAGWISRSRRTDSQPGPSCRRRRSGCSWRPGRCCPGCRACSTYMLSAVCPSPSAKRGVRAGWSGPGSLAGDRAVSAVGSAVAVPVALTYRSAVTRSPAPSSRSATAPGTADDPRATDRAARRHRARRSRSRPPSGTSRSGIPRSRWRSSRVRRGYSIRSSLSTCTRVEHPAIPAPIHRAPPVTAGRPARGRSRDDAPRPARGAAGDLAEVRGSRPDTAADHAATAFGRTCAPAGTGPRAPASGCRPRARCAEARLRLRRDGTWHSGPRSRKVSQAHCGGSASEL